MEVPAGLVGMHWSFLKLIGMQNHEGTAEVRGTFFNFILRCSAVLRLRIHAVHYGE